MAKRFAIILVILLLACNLARTFTYIFSTFHSINAEADDSEKYKKVKLSSSNYSDYISINASIIDYQKRESENLTNQYNFTLKIETHKSQEVKFSNTKITLKSGYELELDSDGYSCIAYVGGCETIGYYSKNIINNSKKVKSVSGYVLIPQE